MMTQFLCILMLGAQYSQAYTKRLPSVVSQNRLVLEQVLLYIAFCVIVIIGHHYLDPVMYYCAIVVIAKE